MAKEKHNYHLFYFKNTLYTGNLNSGLKGTDFTCTQCMINNKNLECFTFSLIFQFFVWVPLKDATRPGKLSRSIFTKTTYKLAFG